VAWIVVATLNMASRLRVFVLPLLVALPLALAACSSESRVCEERLDPVTGEPLLDETTGEPLMDCFYCDALGCRRIVPDCSGSEDCAEGEDCIAGLCQSAPPECTRDEDCDAGDRCTSAGRCRAVEAECTVDTDCEPDERCSAGSCRVEDDLCQFNHECGSTRICIDGRCATECSEANPCEGDGEVCDDGLCRCATEDCVEDDLPPTFCTPEAGCATGASCVGGICRTPCETHQECLEFDVQFSFCLEGYCATNNEVTSDCELSSDCDAGRDCIDGICR
jgi:hypothetical protein